MWLGDYKYHVRNYVSGMKGASSSFHLHRTKVYYKFVPLSGNKDFYDIPMRLLFGDATDANSPSGLSGVFSGHPCPEIAGYKKGISRNTNSLPKSPIYSIPSSYAPKITISPFYTKDIITYSDYKILYVKFELDNFATTYVL